MNSDFNQNIQSNPSQITNKFPIWAIILISVLLTALIVGSATYYFVKNSNFNKSTNDNQISSEPISTENEVTNNNQITSEPIPTKNQAKIQLDQTNETENLKTYINNQYGFELQYPSNWTTKNIGESKLTNGKDTILFNNPEVSVGSNPIISIAVISPGNNDLKQYAREDGSPISIKSEKLLTTKSGIPAYYEIVGDENFISYKDHRYVIGNNKLILDFTFREESRSYSTGGTNLVSEVKLSQYLPNYENIVNSVKFTK